MVFSLDTETVFQFLVGTPLVIAGILVGALVVNRLARRGVKRGLAKIGQGTLREPSRLAARRDRSWPTQAS